jgi:hypothetical protein
MTLTDKKRYYQHAFVGHLGDLTLTDVLQPTSLERVMKFMKLRVSELRVSDVVGAALVRQP